MARFRKKPVVIEAWHWLFNNKQEKDPVWIITALGKWPDMGGIAFDPDHPDGPRIAIATLEGVMVAIPKDYIIQGVKGELYACKPDIFKMTYESAESESEAPNDN